MKYRNPVIRGFYPDPSCCEANGKFYLVTSSFQYFPGVPLFESEDLVNWKQIGHVLSKPSQVELHEVRSSGGVFAPTIRFFNNRFYMVTNNNSTNKNFYVYTDDIYGDWSEPIEVDQDGIDPSLLCDDGHYYFISNGNDENGKSGVFQCEINIETGEKLTDSIKIWSGSGGRYLESPHMYKIGDYYYLMAAEGGTEYGHMVTYARSSSVWGPFENYSKNPVLTNRNKAPYTIQGIGHGDLVKKADGSYFIVTLGFRQIGTWDPYHNLGRETYLTPVSFDSDGWFTCGLDGTCDEYYEIPGDFTQERKNIYTFENTDWNLDWIYLRDADFSNYELSDNSVIMKGTDVTLEEVKSPTFLAIRQLDFKMDLSVNLSVSAAGVSESGLTIYMCENEHYDIAITSENDKYYAILKLNLGEAKHTATKIEIGEASGQLIVKSENLYYYFYFKSGDTTTFLGKGSSRYLTSEVAGGFTGVVMGLYAIGNVKSEFTDFYCKYTED